MSESDWPQVADIYCQGLTTRMATFETEVPDWSDWDEAHLAEPRLIARSGDEIVGWAALGRVSTRPVYSGVAEVSVYVAEGSRERGLGRALLAALVSAADRAGIWTLQASIFPENEASIALHERLGFRSVGRRERIARLDDVWRDVILMERRSSVVK